MHMFDLARRFMGGYGIVGGNLPIAAGIALASDYRGHDEVTLCTFGDGASNQGTFGETLNLAALWRLPVVFMVTNNQFGMGTVARAPLGGDRPAAQGREPRRARDALRRDGRARHPRGRRRGAASACARSAARCSSRPSPTASAATRWPTPRSTARKEEVAQWRERDPIPAVRRAARARGRSSTRTTLASDRRARRSRASSGGRVRRGLAVPGARVAVRRRVRARRPRPTVRRRRRTVSTAELTSRHCSRRRGREAAAAEDVDGECATARRSTRRCARRCARRARGADGRGHRRVRRRLQGHRGPARGVRRAARARHADLREHDRRAWAWARR